MKPGPAAAFLLWVYGCRGPLPANPPRAGSAPIEVTFSSGALELHGFLFRPRGAGPFPAIVYNHGSERDPGAKVGIGTFFAASGYALLVPHRRGHGRSSGVYFRDRVRGLPLEQSAPRIVDELAAQVDDVAAAIAFLRRRRFVDGSRIAIAGCSFGGIETLLTGARSLELRAAVSFAAAAMSWHAHPALRDRLKHAVTSATVPVFFLQAENDFDVTPSKVLSAAMAKAGKPHRVKIYPPHGTTPREGHRGFCNSPRVWGADVLAFLRHHLHARP